MKNCNNLDRLKLGLEEAAILPDLLLPIENKLKLIR